MSEVDDYIDSLPGDVRRRDARTLLELMQRVTGEEPELDRGMIGFGTYHYEYASGRSGDTSPVGFAPRKPATTVYLMDGVGAHEAELAKLGPHTTGVGCLYLKDLSKVDLGVLERIVRTTYTKLAGTTYTARARDSSS